MLSAGFCAVAQNDMVEICAPREPPIKRAGKGPKLIAQSSHHRGYGLHESYRHRYPVRFVFRLQLLRLRDGKTSAREREGEPESARPAAQSRAHSHTKTSTRAHCSPAFCSSWMGHDNHAPIGNGAVLSRFSVRPNAKSFTHWAHTGHTLGIKSDGTSLLLLDAFTKLDEDQLKAQDHLYLPLFSKPNIMIVTSYLGISYTKFGPLESVQHQQ